MVMKNDTEQYDDYQVEKSTRDCPNVAVCD